jgi:hypothetical protein
VGVEVQGIESFAVAVLNRPQRVVDVPRALDAERAIDPTALSNEPDMNTVALKLVAVEEGLLKFIEFV